MILQRLRMFLSLARPALLSFSPPQSRVHPLQAAGTSILSRCMRTNSPYMCVTYNSYLVGIHNKKTNITVMKLAPIHSLARQVKALKNLKPIEVSLDERLRLRNKLGEAFGTKKAKATIRARERNQMDVDAMQGVTTHLQDAIMENTGSLPTMGALHSHEILQCLSELIFLNICRGSQSSNGQQPAYPTIRRVGPTSRGCICVAQDYPRSRVQRIVYILAAVCKVSEGPRRVITLQIF